MKLRVVMVAEIELDPEQWTTDAEMFMADPMGYIQNEINTEYGTAQGISKLLKEWYGFEPGFDRGDFSLTLSVADAEPIREGNEALAP